MALKFAKEPMNGGALVNDGLARIFQRPQGAPAALQAVPQAAVQLTPPHAVYDLRADRIADGGGLETAEASGYRYLVSAPTGAVAAAEIKTDDTGSATLLSHVNFGPFVAATERALASLSALPEVAARSYEVRLLRFSAISLLAIWLKADAGGEDIVYPLLPAPPTVHAETAYSVQHFLAAILPLAKERAGRSGPAVP